MDPHEITELREELRALTLRVAAIEGRTAADGLALPSVAADDTFWALGGLRARLAEDQTTVDGAVMVVGSLTLPDGAVAAWQQTAGTAGLLEHSWEDRAVTIGALGNPVRIEILRQILIGTTKTAELAEIDGLGTTGQLHHHLRQLVAAGWVRHSGRGSYEVPAGRIVPLLALVLGAER